MEGPLDATFYHDDFLTRTLTTSVLYDKSKLALNIADNNNAQQNFGNFGDKRKGLDLHGERESPNLDFLKLESPDLDRMFMTFDENEESNFSHDDAGTVVAAFNMEDEFPASDNCFTDALQLLHDQQDDLPVELDLLEVAIKDEDDILVGGSKSADVSITSMCDVTKIPLVAAPTQICRAKSPSNKNSNPDKGIKSKMDDKPAGKATNSRRSTEKTKTCQSRQLQTPMAANHGLLNASLPFGTNLAPKSQHAHINKPLQQDLASLPTMAPVHISIPEQIALSNQLAILSQAQQLHQQQQEMAFLSQAMGFQSEREVPQQNLTGFPMSQNNHVLPHIQQKMMEQQMLQHHMNGYQHVEGTVGVPNAEALHQMPMDEATIRMFMENPHLTPLSYEMQELIKRERKKLRNRIASSKCRKRKLEREGRLENRVRDLKEKNIELSAVANALKQQVCVLKQRVMDHVGEGCQIMLPSNASP